MLPRYTSANPTASRPPSSRLEECPIPIIVHCHLRWDGVWQRPQQFLSRLSKNHPILFVEGPTLIEAEKPPYFQLIEVPSLPSLTVMQTFFPRSRFQDGAWVDAERARLLHDALVGPLQGKFDRPVQWFYDPMAVTAFAGKFNDRAVVYDCMDELSQFRFAPPELIKREKELLALADVVFAGGRKLHQSKSRFNANCHFYGCGVDVQHFSQARQKQTALPQDIATIQGPILGYFGVVDERLDYELIDQLAAANSQWNVVIIGPVVKVDPATLPKRPNLHWLGRREYAQLPAYTKAFDVCLMPFALNEATEYINPTKALEYMATGKPIVSTPVADVVSNFGTVVDIGKSSQEFIDLCRKAVQTPSQELIQDGLVMADQNGWDTIVGKLEQHILDALEKKEGKPSVDPTVSQSDTVLH